MQEELEGSFAHDKGGHRASVFRHVEESEFAETDDGRGIIGSLEVESVVREAPHSDERALLLSEGEERRGDGIHLGPGGAIG